MDEYDSNEAKQEPLYNPAPETQEPFDLALIAAEDTADMIINHPVSGAPTTWVWTIAGPGHPAAIAADRAASDETRREDLLKEKARVNGRKWSGDFVDSAEQQRRNATYFAKKVLSWTPVRINGTDFPYATANVTKILLDPHYQAIYRQLIDFLVDEKSFMKPSSLNL